MSPVLLVIAGPNGSGKTTVTTRLRLDRWSAGVEYLNPDEVARDRFGDWNSPSAVLEAARWTTERREDLLEQRRSIAFETVFSAPDKVEFVRRAAAAGYFVRLFFVGTEHPSINAGRIARRVMAGGHSVPIDRVISRFGKSMQNLRACISSVDRAYVFDNSVDGADPRICLRTSDGRVRREYPPVAAWVRNLLGDVPRHPEPGS
jgi:predicted ABC-type ATPase